MYTLASGVRPPGTRPSHAPNRLAWLDTLRIVLTVLVVVHHAAQPYGPADWWYVEGQPRNPALATLSAVGGTFAMSLFFFVSAVFVPASYERRGGWSFVKGRLVRLGIPVVVGAVTIVPGLMYAYYVHYRGYPPVSFARYFTDVYLGLGEKPADWTGPSWPDLQFGHLWFIQNLLAYTLLYVLLRVLCRETAQLIRRHRDTPRPPRTTELPTPTPTPVPGHRALLALTAGIAVATFLVRLRYPLDTWVPFLDFLQVEPARLPQHATFFTLGVLAHRYDWLSRFDARTGWMWLSGGLLGVAVLSAVGADAASFGPGGLDGPSALWAAYESALCVALCAGTLTLFREAAGKATTNTTTTVPGPLAKELAASSYAVYIVHLPMVVTVQYYLADRGLTAATAWATAALTGVPAAFALAAGLRRLPLLRRVL
ncbi:acyltransferase [Streptomyces sp. NPDC093085]|uniref:acyltransferase family protein n=1 Tax=Streptomyces sp. NPDC093085 TaxID=3155068 RepID=UPI00341B64AF